MMSNEMLVLAIKLALTALIMILVMMCNRVKARADSKKVLVDLVKLMVDRVRAMAAYQAKGWKEAAMLPKKSVTSGQGPGSHGVRHCDHWGKYLKMIQHEPTPAAESEAGLTYHRETMSIRAATKCDRTRHSSCEGTFSP